MARDRTTRVDRRTVLSTAGVAAFVGLAGCGGGSGGGGGGGGDGGGSEFVTIGTGGTGGVYYPLGGGMADILNQNLDVEASAESTGASVENCRLVANEEMTMALALGNSVLLAVNGEGDFEEALPLSAAFGAYQNVTQVVVPADSPVETLADMEGLTVSVGAPGSGTEVIAEELLGFYDLTYDDIDVQRLSFSETASALQDGQIDAGFWSVAFPASSIQDLASQRDIRLLDFPDEEMDGISGEFDYYNAATVPGGTYEGVDEDVQVPGVTNTMIVREDMGEDSVYDIVEAIYTNLDQLAEVHPAAEQFEDNAREAPIDLHPGAAQYFDDAGL
ncbi:TAXI family TRAP transporter solute-binding subunit [Halalkalicoccus subterraneus]|uniref:TAXI family TRAP transporter solute-binding subunit n=1 Tax=Halalkalicoccus subterraneus TaxID=2675002 RepID=UPI001FE85B3E|nr:TAXI family TRAP transporter solute-binding subunit [Halalkalicoccus subterraneus]